MNSYTVKELFSDWYSAGVKSEKTSDEIELRQKSITLALKNKDVDFWVDLLRLAFGLMPKSEETNSKFVEYFKSKDAVFPLINNENLVRTLACCTIGQKIEDNSDYTSDTLALGVMATTFLEKNSSIPVPQLVTFSKSFWLNECVGVRKTKTNNAESIKGNVSKIELTAGLAAAEFHNELTTHLSNITKDHEKLVNSVKNELSKLIHNNKILSEESNVLWWVFGGYSRDFDIKLKDLGFPASVLQISKELADITQILPGFSNLNSLLTKSLDEVVLKKDLKASKIETFFEFKNSDDVLNGFLEQYPEELMDLLPCHSLIKLKADSDSGASEWIKRFCKKFGIKETIELTPFDLAKQLYIERMLMSAFKNAQ